MPEWLLSLFVNSMIIVGGTLSILGILFLILVVAVEIWDFLTEDDADLEDFDDPRGF